MLVIKRSNLHNIRIEALMMINQSNNTIRSNDLNVLVQYFTVYRQIFQIRYPEVWETSFSVFLSEAFQYCFTTKQHPIELCRIFHWQRYILYWFNQTIFMTNVFAIFWCPMDRYRCFMTFVIEFLVSFRQKCSRVRIKLSGFVVPVRIADFLQEIPEIFIIF